MYSKSLLESSSAMSRFKAMTGFKVSVANTSSSYILISKIKRILKSEMTRERFDELKYRYFSKSTEVRKEVFLDRLVSKIDMFDNDTLKYILHVYDNNGFVEVVDTLRLSQVKLRKLVNASVVKVKIIEDQDNDDDKFEEEILKSISKK